MQIANQMWGVEVEICLVYNSRQLYVPHDNNLLNNIGCIFSDYILLVYSVCKNIVSVTSPCIINLLLSLAYNPEFIVVYSFS